MSDCDPIIEAGDQGEIIDRSDDGTIECAEDGDGGLIITIDETTEFGEKLAWHAGHRGASTAEFVEAAAREFVEEPSED